MCVWLFILFHIDLMNINNCRDPVPTTMAHSWTKAWVSYLLPCVAGVFPFRSGRGEETPAQMAMKKALLCDKTSDLIPIGQYRQRKWVRNSNVNKSRYGCCNALKDTFGYFKSLVRFREKTCMVLNVNFDYDWLISKGAKSIALIPLNQR